MPELQRWSHTRYKLRSLCLTDKYVAVYAHPVNHDQDDSDDHVRRLEDEDSPLVLKPMSIDALCAVEMEDIRFKRLGDDGEAQMEGLSDPYHGVVALKLDPGGSFSICNQAWNFAGILPKKHSAKQLAECTDHLDPALKARLVDDVSKKGRGRGATRETNF